MPSSSSPSRKVFVLSPSASCRTSSIGTVRGWSGTLCLLPSLSTVVYWYRAFTPDSFEAPDTVSFSSECRGETRYAPTALFLSAIEYETSVTAGSSGAAYDAGAGGAKIPRPSTAPTITAARRSIFFIWLICLLFIILFLNLCLFSIYSEAAASVPSVPSELSSESGGSCILTTVPASLSGPAGRTGTPITVSDSSPVSLLSSGMLVSASSSEREGLGKLCPVLATRIWIRLCFPPEEPVPDPLLPDLDEESVASARHSAWRARLRLEISRSAVFPLRRLYTILIFRTKKRITAATARTAARQKRTIAIVCQLSGLIITYFPGVDEAINNGLPGIVFLIEDGLFQFIRGMGSR